MAERELRIPSNNSMEKTTWQEEWKTCKDDKEANKFLIELRGHGKIIKGPIHVPVGDRVAYLFHYVRADQPK